MAAQRLRKTFKYPSGSDDEDAVEAGMDEQNQAELISSLSSHDTSSTQTYTLLLLILPLAPILLYIPKLTDASTVLPSLLAIASLLASAYTLYFLPLPPQQVSIIDSSQFQSQSSTTSQKKKKVGSYSFTAPSPGKQIVQPERKAVPYLSDEVADWLAAYLVTVNIVVAGCLALHEAARGTEWGHSFVLEGGYLPVLICFILLWARRELRVIDMSGLEKLRAGGRLGGDGKMS